MSNWERVVCGDPAKVYFSLSKIWCPSVPTVVWDYGIFIPTYLESPPLGHMVYVIEQLRDCWCRQTEGHRWIPGSQHHWSVQDNCSV